jgi:NMD protein affecting ribosome stability and mRNA decay
MDQPPAEANSQLCPACERIRDHYPAGFLTLSGPFLGEHYETVINTIENEAAQETREHPLNRIMERKREGADLVITTTDVHLPRRVGEALQNAYKGKFDYRYSQEDQQLRARWER